MQDCDWWQCWGGCYWSVRTNVKVNTAFNMPIWDILRRKKEEKIEK